MLKAVVPPFQEEERKPVKSEVSFEGKTEVKLPNNQGVVEEVKIHEDKGKTEIVTTELVNGRQFTVTIRILGKIKPNSSGSGLGKEQAPNQGPA